jgi:hypothetical protein
MAVTPRVTISGRFSVIEVPGLRSVASATSTPAALSLAASGKRMPSESAAPGRRHATTPAAAIAAAPASETCSR